MPRVGGPAQRSGAAASAPDAAAGLRLSTSNPVSLALLTKLCASFVHTAWHSP